jgi:hypothetical protein
MTHFGPANLPSLDTIYPGSLKDFERTALIEYLEHFGMRQHLPRAT